jgi:hypothetical protein
VTVRILIATLIFAAWNSQSGGQQSTLDETSAKEVLTQFCTKDAEGKQLTEEGWQEMSAMFVQHRNPFPGKFIVIRDFGVGRPEIKGNEEAFSVEYIELGLLDSSGRYYNPPGSRSSAPIKIKKEYILVRSDMTVGAESHTAKQTTLARAWKIKKGQELPHITVETAIRYVTELRKHATDEKIRMNAGAALTSLRRQRDK